jgi:hypothetical protein|tara:strand:+ start:1206 stop:1424 length:219 start_codon:yes stop_codon:yes gene_type:complete
MAKQNKYDLEYLYNSYKKFYRKADLEKANKYNDMAIKLHNVDVRERYHAKTAQEENNRGMFGLGKTNRVKYG